MTTRHCYLQQQIHMTLSDLLRDVPLDKPNYMIRMIKPMVMNMNAMTGMI